MLNADGGTRCASITAAGIALRLAVRRLIASGDCLPADLRPSDEDRRSGWTAPKLNDVERANHEMAVMPNELAAISVGLLESNVWLDLDYHLDSRADVDMNVIKTSDDRYVETKPPARRRPTTVRGSWPSWPWPTVGSALWDAQRSPLTRQNERHLFGYATLTRVEWDRPDLNQRPRHLQCRALPTKLLSLSVSGHTHLPFKASDVDLSGCRTGQWLQDPHPNGPS